MTTAPERPSLDVTEVLRFERLRWVYMGAKESAIRERFDMTPVAYYGALARILEDPASLAVDAQIVRRLQRIREQQRAQRSARRLGVISR